MFERTMESSSKNTEEEIEETLKDEEDTSTETGESAENETESEEDTSTNETEDGEETVEALKARLEKAEQDRDNYKQGMLSAKGKKRAEGGISENKIADVNEEAVVKVLAKREEQKALQNTILPKHPDYIPELVDDNQYQQIIGYLPRSVDKTSYESIVRGLKLATKMWKEERGIVDKSSKKNTGLQTSKSSVASNTSAKVEKTGERKILKSNTGPKTWFN